MFARGTRPVHNQVDRKRNNRLFLVLPAPLRRLGNRIRPLLHQLGHAVLPVAHPARGRLLLRIGRALELPGERSETEYRCEHERVEWQFGERIEINLLVLFA